ERVNGTQLQLVIVGLRGRADPSLRSIAARSEHRIHVLGWVDDALLGTLYRRASALAFPSLYEGVGVPILAAMAVGTRVMTSNSGAMAEGAGDAAELVDPLSVDDIRRGLLRVLDDARRSDELRRRGLARAANFTWREAARSTLDVYASTTRSSSSAR